MSTQVGVSGEAKAYPARAGATALRNARKIHLYFGLFIAPALLFFAFTGAVQTLSLHESAGTSYTPPGWLERLGQLHKDQNVAAREPRPPATGGSALARKEGAPTVATALAAPPRSPVTLASKEREHLPEKVFFLLVSLGLFTSTLTGIFMAYKYGRSRMLLTALLLAGIVIPLALLAF